MLNIFSFISRELFSKIADDDLTFADNVDSDVEIPEFGGSSSDYEEVQTVEIIINYSIDFWFLDFFLDCPTFLRLLAILLHISAILVVRQVRCRNHERGAQKNPATNGARQQKTEGCWS